MNSVRTSFSQDSGRVVMSSEACLVGLFPPRGGQIWNKHLNWQPIPVYAIPYEKMISLMQQSDAIAVMMHMMLSTK